jgi:hypothetical protein
MRTLRALALCGLMALGFASTANATITTANAIPLEANRGATIPGIFFNIPALAQNDSAQCVFNVQRLFPIEDDGGDAWNSNIMWGISNTTTGTDSFTVNIQGAFSNTGPWTSLYAGTLQANTVVGPGTATQQDNATGAVAGGTGMYVTKFAAAATTLLPFPYMRVQIRLRGATAITVAEGVKFYVLFPQNNAQRPNAGN